MTDLKAPYAEARERLATLTSGMSDQEWNQKPSKTGWSAGECVVHLNTIAKGYLPVFEEVARGDGPRGEGPFAYGWVSRTFVNAVRPGSRPISTAAAMRPPETSGLTSDIDRQRALGRFDSDIDRYLAAIDAADGLDLAAIKVRSPFLKILRLPVGAFIEALGVHSVRHVMQAERAVESARQPRFA